MRVHLRVPRCQQVARTVERGEAHPEPGERVGATLLAVDDAHRMPDDEPGCANGLHRVTEGPARRDDVLDEAHELTWLVDALEAVPGAVSLGFIAHDDEGHSGRHGSCGGQRDRSEGGAGEPRGVRIDFEFNYPTGVSRPYMPQPEDTFNVIRTQLQAVGLKVKPTADQWDPDYLEKIQGTPDHGIHLLGWTRDYNDTDNFLGVFFGTATAE